MVVFLFRKELVVSSGLNKSLKLSWKFEKDEDVHTKMIPSWKYMIHIFMKTFLNKNMKQCNFYFHRGVEGMKRGNL